VYGLTCMKFNADFDLQQPGAPIMTFFVEHKGSSSACADVLVARFRNCSVRHGPTVANHDVG
jgi:hypothetical protein